MNKKLIALAVAGALAAPLAAQAEANVYGIVHTSIDIADNGGSLAAGDDVSKNGVNVTSNSSRVGIKGSEDLGGGMKAVYQMEWGVNVTDTSALTQRNQFVGLGGGFGTVLVGRHDTPYKLAVSKLDAFADTVGDYNNVVGAIAGGAVKTLDTRADNVIAYASPNFAGVSALVAYVPDPSDDNVDDDATSFNVKYENGPLFVGLGYILVNNAAPTVAPEAEATGTRLGVGYKFGTTQLGVIYDQTSVDADTLPDSLDSTNIYASVASDIGSNTVKAAVGQIDFDEASGAPSQDATFFAVGASHHFSKATEAYVVYASLDNDKGAAYTLGHTGSGLGLAGVNNETSTSLSLGIKHKF